MEWSPGSSAAGLRQRTGHPVQPGSARTPAGPGLDRRDRPRRTGPRHLLPGADRKRPLGLFHPYSGRRPRPVATDRLTLRIRRIYLTALEDQATSGDGMRPAHRGCGALPGRARQQTGLAGHGAVGHDQLRTAPYPPRRPAPLRSLSPGCTGQRRACACPAPSASSPPPRPLATSGPSPAGCRDSTAPPRPPRASRSRTS